MELQVYYLPIFILEQGKKHSSSILFTISYTWLAENHSSSIETFIRLNGYSLFD